MILNVNKHKDGTPYIFIKDETVAEKYQLEHLEKRIKELGIGGICLTENWGHEPRYYLTLTTAELATSQTYDDIPFKKFGSNIQTK